MDRGCYPSERERLGQNEMVHNSLYQIRNLLSATTCNVTMRLSHGRRLVPRVLLYPSARLSPHRRAARRVISCRHEPAALGARTKSCTVNVHRIYYKRTRAWHPLVLLNDTQAIVLSTLVQSVLVRWLAQRVEATAARS
jgi:hypothetical protein